MKHKDECLSTLLFCGDVLFLFFSFNYYLKRGTCERVSEREILCVCFWEPLLIIDDCFKYI